MPWDERLQNAWREILSRTKGYLQKGSNVVIDFVVEDELEWFCKQVSDPDVAINYVVLITDKENILKRLGMRNEIKYKDRSLFLLDKLSKNPQNAKYLYDTTGKNIPDIVQEIAGSSRFTVHPPLV